MVDKTGKKIISVILTLALTLSLMPALTLTASAADHATFSFKSNTSPVADDTGMTASDTVTQAVNGKTIQRVSAGGQFVVGAASALLGDYPTALFVGNIVAFDAIGDPYSTRVTVSLPGYIFDLNAIDIFDTCNIDHLPNTINLI